MSAEPITFELRTGDLVWRGASEDFTLGFETDVSSPYPSPDLFGTSTMTLVARGVVVVTSDIVTDFDAVPRGALLFTTVDSAYREGGAMFNRLRWSDSPVRCHVFDETTRDWRTVVITMADAS